MVLGIVGGRDFNSYTLLEKSVKNLLHYKQITEIVSGGAMGADKLAMLFAISNSLKIKEFIPDWRPNNIYDSTAGFKRNKLIVDYADIVIAFHDGSSRGTANSISIAKKLSKPCYIIKYSH